MESVGSISRCTASLIALIVLLVSLKGQATSSGKSTYSHEVGFSPILFAKSSDQISNSLRKHYVVSFVYKTNVNGVSIVVAFGVNSPGVIISDTFVYSWTGSTYRLNSTFWRRHGLPEWKADSTDSSIAFSYSESKAQDRIQLDMEKLY